MTDLDRQIAEKLFPGSIDLHRFNCKYETPFSPSSRIDHAWRMVDEMQRRGYHFALHVFSDGCSYAIFHYGKFGDGDLDERGTALTSSTPEAICRAALEALKNDNS